MNYFMEKSTYGVFFKPFLNSQNMKILSSDLAYVHTHRSILIGIYMVVCFWNFSLYRLIMKKVLSAFDLIVVLIKLLAQEIEFIVCCPILVNQWNDIH